MTTQKLNKLFHIPGYKVTKIKGEICLRSIKQCETISESNEDLELMKQEIKNIKDAFNQLSDQLETIKHLILPNEE